MNKRTNEEVKAYVDGYNACYDRFVEVLMQRGSVTKAIEKMDMFKEATNSVLLTENVGTCQQNVGEKNRMTNQECDNNHDCEHCNWTECPLEVEKEREEE